MDPKGQLYNSLYFARGCRCEFSVKHGTPLQTHHVLRGFSFRQNVPTHNDPEKCFKDVYLSINPCIPRLTHTYFTIDLWSGCPNILYLSSVSCGVLFNKIECLFDNYCVLPYLSKTSLFNVKYVTNTCIFEQRHKKRTIKHVCFESGKQRFVVKYICFWR